MKYIYFVYWESEDGKKGKKGNGVVQINEPIVSHDQIRQLQYDIELEFGWVRPMIQSITKLN